MRTLKIGFGAPKWPAPKGFSARKTPAQEGSLKQKHTQIQLPARDYTSLCTLKKVGTPTVYGRNPLAAPEKPWETYCWLVFRGESNSRDSEGCEGISMVTVFGPPGAQDLQEPILGQVLAVFKQRLPLKRGANHRFGLWNG